MKIIKALGIALLVVAGLELHAQTINGRILGTVHDQTGAAIPNATVIVTDTQRSLSRQVVTDESGEFVVTALPPSVYTVRAEARGFETVEH
ncbi:MAG TPA: carboxypeptidase-like regulatory domain-containing protein, partial [Terriglobales bacterium]